MAASPSPARALSSYEGSCTANHSQHRHRSHAGSGGGGVTEGGEGPSEGGEGVRREGVKG